MDAIVDERTQKIQEALKTSKDDTLLSSDEEVAENKSDDDVAEAKLAEKEVKEINNEPLEEGEARLSDQEEPPENEDEKYETENLEEKRKLNKMTYGIFCMNLLKNYKKTAYYDKMIKTPSEMQKRLLDMEGKANKGVINEEDLFKEMKNLEEIAEVEEEDAGRKSEGF